MHRMVTVHASPRQTDRQTEEHHGNSVTVGFNEHIPR